MYPFLVADIGGTNARFATVLGKDRGHYQLQHITKLSGRDHASFSAALRTYLDELDMPQPKYACIAIAGPVDGSSIKMTNLPWAFSAEGLAEEFSFDSVQLMNDFAALAAATSELAESHLQLIKPGEAALRGNKAILGPGTGLGVAGLVNANGHWQPISSEGGHVNLAPSTALECEVIAAGMKRHGHVSAETFISGPGLVNLYTALADVRGESALHVQPQQVSAAAVSNSDALSRQSLQLFCSFLGALAGNLALTYGAKGGVYLAGGILPRLIDFFRSSEFNQRFSEKGIMSNYLTHIPVNLVAYEYSALLGAAAWLDQKVATKHT
ncbi:MAG: glucokinase [Cellvibrionaceae bacterium]|nr:glucokinase [Cellvibrionaceae bacterium]